MAVSEKVMFQSCGEACAVLNRIKPLVVSSNIGETPPATVRLHEPHARSWALCGHLVPSAGAGTGSRCRGTPRLGGDRVTALSTY